MRLREQELPLDPQIERELAALDRALAGEAIDPDLESLAELALDLRARRPQPSAEAERTLDELAASGFPPRASDRLGRASRRVSDAIGGLRAKGARRLIPALGAATRVPGRGRGRGSPPVGSSTAGTVQVGPGARRATPSRQGTGRSSSRNRHPRQPTRRRYPRRVRHAPRPSMPTSHLPLGRPPKASPQAPPAASRPRTSTSSSPPPPATSVTPPTGCSTWSATTAASCSTPTSPAAIRRSRGPSAGARASSSESRPGSCRRRWATSRTSATSSRAPTAPWTSPSRFVSARKRIDTLTAARARLLRELGEASTIAEQQSIRARLRIVERRLAAAHDDLAKVQQRVHLVPVSVAITADEHADSGGAWSIGDAFHDAGRVLTVTAGAALVAAAALLPIALLAALGVAAWRGWVRRQRGRALDAPAG